LEPDFFAPLFELRLLLFLAVLPDFRPPEDFRPLADLPAPDFFPDELFDAEEPPLRPPVLELLVLERLAPPPELDAPALPPPLDRPAPPDDPSPDDAARPD
jgi:hypothetical protein